MTLSRTRGALAPILRARKETRCRVRSCRKSVHGLSSLCNAHKIAASRYGEPTQRRILRAETKPYQRTVGRILTANRGPPAVAFVVAELDGLLAEGARLAPLTPHPRRSDWRSKLHVELARL